MTFGNFVQSLGGVSNSASPYSLAYSSNNTLGNILIVGGRINANSAPTISDSLGNTWVSQIADNWRLGNTYFMAYAIKCKAGANTVQITAAGAISICVAEFVGLGTAAFDKSSFADNGTGTWTTADSGVITPSANNALIVSTTCQGTTGNPGVTAGSGFSNLTNDNAQIASLESQIQATKASIHGIFTYGSAVTGACGVMSFINPQSGSSSWLKKHRDFINKR